MNILSLFDGMSCGQIALKEISYSIDNYYASEVDKHAIKLVKHNFPNTRHIGDVRNIDISELPKIDLLMGGSPCQNFSFAGTRKGMSTKTEEEITTLERYLELKKQDFEFEGESYLFWEFLRILKEIRKKNNPDVKFLLENVVMAKKWEGVINRALGIYPVKINSSLVSAQNRKRLYWSNVRVMQYGLFGEKATDIPQPKDKELTLKDILEDKVDERFYLSDDVVNNLIEHKERNEAKWYGFGAKFHKEKEKMSCLKIGGSGVDDLVLQIPEATNKGYAEIEEGQCFDFEQPNSKTRRGRLMGDKSNALLTQNEFMQFKKGRIRRLTPLECQRLQTVPEWYNMSVISDTQRYKTLGNGWTVEVIKHILRFL